MPASHAPSFPTTCWSRVARAQDADPLVRQEALAALLKSYLAPLRYYLVATRHLRGEAADDVLQDFVSERVLRDQLIPTADRSRGRFRSFLLTALNRFVSNVRRAQNAQKRRAVEAVVLDDLPDLENGPTAEQAFAAAWARALLGRAVEGVRAECEASGRDDVWAVFDARVLGPTLSGDPPVTYEDLSKRLGLDSARDASNLLVTGKRMFGRRLRELIAEYEPDPNSIDAEIAEIKAILARSSS